MKSDSSKTEVAGLSAVYPGSAGRFGCGVPINGVDSAEAERVRLDMKLSLAVGLSRVEASRYNNPSQTASLSGRQGKP